MGPEHQHRECQRPFRSAISPPTDYSRTRTPHIATIHTHARTHTSKPTHSLADMPLYAIIGAPLAHCFDSNPHLPVILCRGVRTTISPTASAREWWCASSSVRRQRIQRKVRGQGVWRCAIEHTHAHTDAHGGRGVWSIGVLGVCVM